MSDVPLIGALSPPGQLGGALQGNGGLSGSIGFGRASVPPYDGPYTVTPTQYTQTLLTEGKRAAENIVIDPIPSNYGLITWDGSVLTVS